MKKEIIIIVTIVLVTALGITGFCVYKEKMNENMYIIKITNIDQNEYKIRIYAKDTKVLDYNYYQEENN